MRLIPIVAAANVDQQRNFQLGGRTHQRADPAGTVFELILGHFEDQFVVHLHDHVITSYSIHYTKLYEPRYEEVSVLGKGGGGQVWAVRDRLTGETVALKALAVGASEREAQALVREAVTLSGLEGLGVPKVFRFGRLPESGRPYLVRELVVV